MSPIREVATNTLFRRLWVSQIASQLSSNILIFLLALLIYRRTGSNAAVSGLFLSYGLPSFLFGVVAGTIVDRLDRRAVLIVSHISRMLLVVAVASFEDRIVATYLLMFVFSVINQLTMPSEAPLIPQFVPKNRLVTANSLFSFTFFGSMGLGLIAAGPMLRFIGREGAYVLLVSLYIVAAIAVMKLPPQGEGVRSLRRIFSYDFWYILRRVFQNMEGGIRYVVGSRSLREAVALLTGTQITLVLLATLGPGFADTVLRIDVRDASLLIVGPTIAGILAGALWLGKNGNRWNTSQLMDRGLLAGGTVLITISLLFSATNSLWFSVIPRWIVLATSFLLFITLGVANSFLDVPSNTVLQREAGVGMRGRVYGILSASVGGAGMLPIVVSGILADLIGVGSVIFILGVIVLGFGYFGRRRQV